MRIRLTGHGPLQNYPKAKVPWEDIYVSYDKPTKNLDKIPDESKRGTWAPVLIGRNYLRSEIDLNVLCLKECSFKNFREYGYNFRLDEIKHQEINILLSLKELTTVSLQDGSGGPSLYCREKFITRRIAERMISHMLTNFVGSIELKRLKPFEFIWIKSKHGIIIPTSFGPNRK